MRKAIAVVIFLSASGLLLLAMNQSFINGLKQGRYFDHLDQDSTAKRALYQKVFMRSDRWAYGDLYGISYLHQYKHKLEPFKKYQAKEPTNYGRNLYIIGDSFTADKTFEGAFSGFDRVFFLDRRFPFGPIALDTAAQNYLIMEFSEHNAIRYNAVKSPELLWTAKEIQEKAFFNKTLAAEKAPPTQLPKGAERVNKALFNKDLSRNLETILFEDKIFTPLKELKAAFNYRVLGRLPKEVAVSTDKQRLLLGVTVDTSLHESSFNHLTEADVDQIDQQLNISYKYYRSIGFRKVFLTIVPNAASVYDEHRMPYNHLIERLESRSIVPVISVYNLYKADKRNLFYKSDAHWNPLGLDLWVQQANRVLQKEISTL